MKTIKIGSSDYELCENAEDLGIKRYNELKALMVFKETGVSIPSLIDTWKKRMAAYDNESKSGMVIADYNFLLGLNKIEEREDTDQMIFGIICNEKDEDVTKYDATKSKEKIDRMSANGLTQGFVKKEVEDFLKGSPILSELYFLKNLESLNQSLTS